MAGSLAPRSPEVLVSKGMAGVGEAAAAGEAPGASVLAGFDNLLSVAPLRAEPLLFRAALAQRAGEMGRAETLLLKARRRDPRSAAARYLLAEVWLDQGRIEEGLGEMAILSRLQPGGAAQLAPALSQFAEVPGASRQLKRMIQQNPQLKLPLLEALSANPDNMELVLDLNGGERAGLHGTPPQWQRILLTGLVNKDDLDQAYRLWRRLTGFEGPRPLLFNPEFRRLSAPPPFNWDFQSSGAGVAEPGEGQMRVLFYGRDNAALASQLLLLPAGTYRFAVRVAGLTADGALYWKLTCIPPKGPPLMEVPLASAQQSATFRVTVGCEAQRIELLGRATDSPQTSDLLVGPALIKRIGA